MLKLIDHVLTPADQLNIVILHNIEDQISRENVRSYGPDEDIIIDGFFCPFKVGKLYITIRDTYFIKILNTNLIEPEFFAEDEILDKDAVIIFLGIERFIINKNLAEGAIPSDDSFSLYTLKFLYGDEYYHQLIPTKFTYDGVDWTYNTTTNIQTVLQHITILDVNPL